jgi:ubiquinol-cytochrome c reductase cytochrome b subunit
MRDVNYGWLMRYVHANGASMFFLVVYVHIFRGLYYGSYFYPRQAVWGIGVIIVLLMILTAFMGYVLPWGQMSFWAATVITNLASAVPVIGNDIVCWLCGGFSVDNATLNRFFSLHYLFPFILVALAGIHLILLHEVKSNNVIGTNTQFLDKIPFTPYFVIKDIFGLVIFLILFFYLVYFDPNLLGHSDNYIPANPLVTPAHIVPEWYFLPFYAILRLVPDKLGGVILLVGAIVILLVMPFFVKAQIRSSQFRPIKKILFWLFFFNYLLLGWIGGQPVEFPFVEIGQLCTSFYFLYFIFFLPFIYILEINFWNENKITINNNDKKFNSFLRQYNNKKN